MRKDLHPKEKLNVRFQNLAISKGMTSDELVGVILRDDQFLNLMSSHPDKEIDKIWREVTGKDNQKGKLAQASSR